MCQTFFAPKSWQKQRLGHYLAPLSIENGFGARNDDDEDPTDPTKADASAAASEQNKKKDSELIHSDRDPSLILKKVRVVCAAMT